MSNVQVVLPELPFAHSEANVFSVSRGTFISIAFHLFIFILILILSYHGAQTKRVLTEITLVEQIIPVPDSFEPVQSLAKTIAAAPNEPGVLSKLFQPKPNFNIPDLHKFKPSDDISALPGKEPDLVGKKAGNLISPPESALKLGSGLHPGSLYASPAVSHRMTKYVRRGLSDLPAIYPPLSKPAIAAESGLTSPNPSTGAFQISGDLSGRKILSLALPKYPRWAEEQGLESSVTLRITVGNDGKVLPNILIERSSGYSELDTLALESIKQFVFSASRKIVSGNITFNFSLRK
jgi:TonB family protein